MYKAHIYLGDSNNIRRLEHIPNCGDTIRAADDQYYIVTEVIFCLNEESSEGQRVNIRAEVEDES